MKETAVCPAGHKQSFVRMERAGRCTVCGNSLVRGVFDDTLPDGLMVRGGARGQVVPTTEEAPVEEGQ